MTALRLPAFRRLWTAGLISDGGDWLLLVALPILVYQLTGSTLGTALAFLVELAPPILLGPVAGRLADRWDRRRALIVISLLQAGALLPLVLTRELWAVYTVIAAEAVLATLFDPSKSALLPTLVPPADLVPANALLAVNANLGRLAGGSLGGALLAFSGVHVVVAVDAVTFLLAAALISGVPAGAPSPAPAAAPSEKPARAGRSPLWRVLATAAVCAVAQGIFTVLFVPFVARVLHGDAAETGLLRGVQAIGAIAAGLLLGLLPTGRRTTKATTLTAVGAGVFGVVALACWNGPLLTRAEPLYLVLFILAGAPGTFLETGLISTLQSATPAATRGRAFGMLGMVYAAGQALGELGAGLLGDRVGVLPLLNTQACLYLLGAAIALLPLGRHGPGRYPTWRRSRRTSTTPTAKIQ